MRILRGGGVDATFLRRRHGLERNPEAAAEIAVAPSRSLVTASGWMNVPAVPEELERDDMLKKNRGRTRLIGRKARWAVQGPPQSQHRTDVITEVGAFYTTATRTPRPSLWIASVQCHIRCAIQLRHQTTAGIQKRRDLSYRRDSSIMPGCVRGDIDAARRGARA